MTSDNEVYSDSELDEGEDLNDVEKPFRQVQDETFARWSNKPASHPIIYHYTSADSLIRILEGRCFLASHYRFMNDKKEYVYILDVVDRYLKTVTDTAHVELIREMREHYLSTVQGSILQPYLACFSKEPDSLSQWRAYANNGAGFAIGIDTGSLPRHSGPLSGPRKLCQIELSELDYDEDHQLSTVSYAMEKMLAALDAVSKDEYIHGFRWMTVLLMTLGSECKSKKFEEEKEWRFRALHTRTKRHKDRRTFHFRATPLGLAPAIALEFENGHMSPIVEIVAGPKLDYNEARYAIECLLEEHGFLDVDISHSAASYR